MIALLLIGSSVALAEPIKTVQPELKKLMESDLATQKPLVISQEGVYSCPAGYDMYVRSKQTNMQLVKVQSLGGSRIISDKKNPVGVMCVSAD
jgi:hypothetical protein